jgi:hypothetical protein
VDMWCRLDHGSNLTQQPSLQTISQLTGINTVALVLGPQ